MDEFDSMNVRTAGFPAVFGSSLGGVVELNTNHDAVPGLHGQMSYQGGSFDQQSGFASLQYSRGRNAVSLSGEGFLTDRYLDAPVEQNTPIMPQAELFRRGLTAPGRRPFDAWYISSRHTVSGANDNCSRRPASARTHRRRNAGAVSHTHLFNARVVMQVRGWRDTSALLVQQPFDSHSADADRGFRRLPGRQRFGDAWLARA